MKLVYIRRGIRGAPFNIQRSEFYSAVKDCFYTFMYFCRIDLGGSSVLLLIRWCASTPMIRKSRRRSGRMIRIYQKQDIAHFASGLCLLLITCTWTIIRRSVTMRLKRQVLPAAVDIDDMPTRLCLSIWKN